MAEKTTKKAAEKKELTLAQQVAAKRTELFEQKRSLAAGELVNPRVITATRKEIARLLTAIRAEELSVKESK